MKKYIPTLKKAPAKTVHLLLPKVKLLIALLLNENVLLISKLALFGAISANGYQLAVYGNPAKLLTDVQITNIQVCPFY